MTKPETQNLKPTIKPWESQWRNLLGKTCHDRKNLSFDDLTFWRSDRPFFRSMFNAAILSFCWSWQQCRWVAAKENSGRWTGHTTHIHTYICFRYPSLQQASWQRWAIWSCWSIKFKKMKKSSTNPKLWSPHSLQLEHTVGPSASEVELAYSNFLVFFFETPVWPSAKRARLSVACLNNSAADGAMLEHTLKSRKCYSKMCLKKCSPFWRYFDGKWRHLPLFWRMLTVFWRSLTVTFFSCDL